MAKGPITEEKIKISGDGAKMSRIANFILLPFSIISDKENIMSAYGNIAFMCFALCSSREHVHIPSHGNVDL